jgi:hypothetical protein
MNMRSFRWQWLRRLALIGLSGLCCVGSLTAPAPETDNFSLPLDIELADLGEYFEAVHTFALEEAVAAVNARIEQALTIGDSAARTRQLAVLHDPDALADAFMGRFSDAVTEFYKLENALSGKWARQTWPGQKTTHNAIWMNFSAHVPIIDPRQWMMLSQCRTVKAYGVYFGTDKCIHFHHVGYSYYKMYRALLKQGLSAEEADRKVIEHHVAGGLLGEKALFGTVFTGIYSNADLAVNRVGFKFLLNLTEEVILKGQPRPPLALRCGMFWRLNQQVRPRSGWFAAFLSDHWNEALNPSLYEASMRPGIRRVLRSRAEHIVQFYTQKDGRPNDPAYFDNLAHELSTYYGEPYGHSGQFDKLMTIGNTCIPALADPRVSRTQ